MSLSCSSRFCIVATLSTVRQFNFGEQMKIIYQGDSDHLEEPGSRRMRNTRKDHSPNQGRTDQPQNYGRKLIEGLRPSNPPTALLMLTTTPTKLKAYEVCQRLTSQRHR